MYVSIVYTLALPTHHTHFKLIPTLHIAHFAITSHLVFNPLTTTRSSTLKVPLFAYNRSLALDKRIGWDHECLVSVNAKCPAPIHPNSLPASTQTDKGYPSGQLTIMDRHLSPGNRIWPPNCRPPGWVFGGLWERLLVGCLHLLHIGLC